MARDQDLLDTTRQSSLRVWRTGTR
jgi:hypothetical protein